MHSGAAGASDSHYGVPQKRTMDSHVNNHHAAGGVEMNNYSQTSANVNDDIPFNDSAYQLGKRS